MDHPIVEVKDVELNQNMVRAMAREAEAERERRAKVISAQGDLESAERLSTAAAEMNKGYLDFIICAGSLEPDYPPPVLTGGQPLSK